MSFGVGAGWGRVPLPPGVKAPEQTDGQLQIRSGLSGTLSHNTQPGWGLKPDFPGRRLKVGY